MEKDEIKLHYAEKKEEIDDRLRQFEQLRDAGEERLFQELVFVILTSQSSAENAWEAAEELQEKNLLINGNKKQIEKVLSRNEIQYERNKASYIVGNRKKLSQPTLSDPSKGIKLRNRINPENLEKTREQLVDDMKGVSWKGGSHFLRNIGYGNSFGIISGYISKILFKMDMKENPEQPKNREEYMDMEREIQSLAEELEIDVKALDLVLWSMETGEVFK